MNPNHPTPDPHFNHRARLAELASGFIDRTITPEEIEELEFLLRDSEANRTFFLQYMDLQATIPEVLAEITDDRTEACSPVFDWASTLAQYAESRKTPATIGTAGQFLVPPLRASNLAPWLIAIASLAVSCLFAISFYLTRDVNLATSHAVRSSHASEHLELVRLTSVADAELFDESVPVIGAPLKYHHEYALVTGIMSLTFPCGAEVILEAPSVIEITDPMRMLIKAGKCSVHAPDGAEGFRVDTPDNTIVDLGTRFAVKVSDAGRTDVHVVEGAAEISSLASPENRSKRLNEHQALRLDGVKNTTIKFRPSEYRLMLPDRVVRYQSRGEGEQCAELLSVTVQRGGRMIEYPVEDLIGIDITYFRSSFKNRHVAWAEDMPLTDVRDALQSDRSLISGLINIGGSVQRLTESPKLDADYANAGTDAEGTEGMAIQFARPVQNDAGPDVVLFEVQSVLDTPHGDPFHVSPLVFETGLRSHTISRYDISMKSPEAQRAATFDLIDLDRSVSSLDKLRDFQPDYYRPSVGFLIVATGIDLSDLGYPEGQSVSGLFLQDAMDNHLSIDPMFIAGFPELKNE